MAPRTLKRPPRQLAQAIDGDGLRVVFASILGKNWRMPDGAALAELASILAFWRSFFHVSIDVVPPQKRALALAVRLTGALQALDFLYIDALTRSRLFTATAIQKRRDLVDALLTALALAPMPNDPSWSDDLTWLELSDALLGDLEIAIRSTNLGYKNKVGHGDNLPEKFIAAILPHVSGEHLAASSIATELKTARRGRKLRR